MDENKNLATSKEDVRFISDSEQNPSLKFGWGRFRPRCLQFLNSPKWFIVGIFLYSLCQGVTMMGLPTLTLPSIEKRFSLSAKEMGIIAASNDVSALILVVFISFYGDYGNKIRWIGVGGLIVGFGALLYALPHFLIGAYEPTSQTGSMGFCYNGGETFTKSQIKCNLDSGSRWYYKAIFILSQLITGAGISPYYSLVPAYLDENVHPKSLAIYLGIWTCANFLGPGLGMLVGGKMLSIYVDLKQPDGVHLTSRDPRWVGAWWLGFVVFGCIILVSSLLVLGFPRELPGAKQRRQKHINKGHLRKANKLQNPSLKEILPELKNLLTNWTFLFNTLGLTATLLYVGSIFPFLSKILQLKFGLKPENTGYAIALTFSPTALTGIVVGSAVLRQFSLKDVCKKAALFILILRLPGFLSPMSFLVNGCTNVNLAGLTTPYNQRVSKGQMQEVPSDQNVSFTASCNVNCRCSLSRFAPVCGSDNVTYFDKCHAGCTRKLSNKEFGNCSCIAPHIPGSGFGTAKMGYCDRDCKNLIPFLGILAINIIVQFAKMVPDKTVTLRCVPDNKRAFANGIQYLSMKTLGLLPGPIVFGHIVDSYCRLWQDTCGEKGRCFDYDIDKLSKAVCIYGSCITLFSITFYFLSWFLYKPEKKEKGLVAPPNDQAEAVDSSSETKV